jgi:hypothetical protein
MIDKLKAWYEENRCVIHAAAAFVAGVIFGLIA